MDQLKRHNCIPAIHGHFRLLYEPPEEFGAQKSKAIVGETDLLRFLQLINVDADDLKTGSRVLYEHGYVEFANIVLSDERLASFDLR